VETGLDTALSTNGKFINIPISYECTLKQMCNNIYEIGRLTAWQRQQEG